MSTVPNSMDKRDDGQPGLGAVLLRGLLRRCPQCGHGALYRRYLKPVDACSACHEALGFIRADDMPAYVTIVVVGHILVPLAVITEKLYQWPVWLHLSLWLPLTVIMTLTFLPAIKGATLGLMWKLKLRGDETQ